jgi:hypothetical protein
MSAPTRRTASVPGADDAVVVDGLKAPAGAYNACLGDASRAALDVMGKARRVSYRVTRAPGDDGRRGTAQNSRRWA